MGSGYWLDLGLLPYAPAFAIQKRLFEALTTGRLPATIILQENPPTFTIGRDGSQANILAAPSQLAALGIEVVEVTRGGDVTYHGPGQIVASPLLYLGTVGLNANQYLHRLEDVLIGVLAGYGLSAGKLAGYPGVWLNGSKIGAVGIAVRNGYTFHGLSLNVTVDLMPFDLINPCGVPKMPVTSLARALGRDVPLAEARGWLRRVLGSAFGLELLDISWPDLEASLP